MTKSGQVIMVFCCAASLWAQDKVNQDSLVLDDFTHRVADYVKLHNQIRARIHGLKTTTSQETIGEHVHKLARSMREARRDAKQGDLFTPETVIVFHRLIGQTMHGSEGTRIQTSLRNDDRPAKVPEVHVNGRYPEDAALPSMPPSVLMNLPPLPPELEYRVVGHALILRDQSANLIVDYIPNAIP
jgi:hypothetical protein